MELAQWKEKLDAWFNDKEPEMFALLERIVNMDSFSHDGGDVNRLGETLAAWMAGAGFQAAMLPKRPSPPDEAWMDALGNVFCARSHAEEAGPGVAFIGHMDTVFPAGTAAARPFRLDRAADRATGPGILDMKAGLVINMFVARALKELDLMPVPMTLTFSPDEELGSPSTTPLLGQVLNGAHAVLCTEPGYPGGGVSVERKGSGHFLLEIQGKSAHAGRNYEEGASADAHSQGPGPVATGTAGRRGSGVSGTLHPLQRSGGIGLLLKHPGPAGRLQPGTGGHRPACRRRVHHPLDLPAARQTGGPGRPAGGAHF